MTKKQKNFTLVILLLAVLFYVSRASFRKGDFIGYINAGHLVINGQDIYSDFLNTWPPFFSICSIPLSLLDDLNGIALRAVWLLLMLAAMFWLMRITVRWIYGKKLLLPFQKEQSSSIVFSNSLALIPLLILFRYLLDNLANIQINIFLLLASIIVIDLFIKEKPLWSGMILAFIISLKVFPIFLLLYFIFKREVKLVSWTLLFLCLFNAFSLLVYGFEQGTVYYEHWWNNIASQPVLIDHKNQSFLSMLRRLLTNESPGLDIHLNLIDLSLDTFKKVATLVLVVGALYPMYLFRQQLTNKMDGFAILEYTFILTSIPILSPLAWKAYFIFLWPGYLLAYHYLYDHRQENKLKNLKGLKILFLVSILFTVASTDLFLGGYYADLMEVYSIITLGTLLLMGILLMIYASKKKDVLVRSN